MHTELGTLKTERTIDTETEREGDRMAEAIGGKPEDSPSYIPFPTD